MRPNKLRKMLQAGLPTLGTRLNIVWPGVVEAIGHTGLFDYVEFLAEYAPYDLVALENFCRAAELFDLSTMIKVDQASRDYYAQRAIGAGFQSVMFADCRTVEDVRRCVRIVRPDTPEDGGEYGSAFRRFAYMDYGGGPGYVQALREVVIVLMVEKKPAVDQLEEILAVPGIDMVQWGPADYSMSIGKPGQKTDPQVKSAEQKVIETCLKMGIPPRVELSTPEEAIPYMDMGLRHFSLGVDLRILFNWLSLNGERLRKMLVDNPGVE